MGDRRQRDLALGERAELGAVDHRLARQHPQLAVADGVAPGGSQGGAGRRGRRSAGTTAGEREPRAEREPAGAEQRLAAGGARAHEASPAITLSRPAARATQPTASAAATSRPITVIATSVTVVCSGRLA